MVHSNGNKNVWLTRIMIGVYCCLIAAVALFFCGSLILNAYHLTEFASSSDADEMARPEIGRNPEGKNEEANGQSLQIRGFEGMKGKIPEEWFPQGTDTLRSCTDGIDNNGDGLTDNMDPGCWDTDHDGINDTEDRCPDIPGTWDDAGHASVLNGYFSNWDMCGCPVSMRKTATNGSHDYETPGSDPDEDGVPNPVDQCPNIQAPAWRDEELRGRLENDDWFDALPDHVLEDDLALLHMGCADHPPATWEEYYSIGDDLFDRSNGKLIRTSK